MLTLTLIKKKLFCIRDILNEPLHSVRAVLFHLFGNVAVSVEGECGGVVSEVVLYCFYIVAGLDRIDGVSVSQIVEA